MTTDSAKNMYLQEIHQFRDYVVANTNMTELASLNLLGVIMLLTAAIAFIRCVRIQKRLEKQVSQDVQGLPAHEG